MMKIEFILPSHSKRKRELKLGPIGFNLPSLTLASLASCVPDEIEVKLTDEHVEEICEIDNGSDIIGINTRSQTALRAYDIADRFRKLGKTVILGGVHASLLPEEALEHADAVVIGEAEGIIERILEDFQSGRLKKSYQHRALPDISELALPRKDLLYHDGIRYAPVDLVMISRGCPHGCNFCYLSAYPNRNYRLRRIDCVIHEIEQLKNRLVFFVDDNLCGHPKYSLDFFERLIPYRKIWVGQATLNVANDRKLLKTLSKSGCKCLFIGFESLSQPGLVEMGKPINKVQEFREKIKIIQDHGIMLYGGFILGLDQDDQDVFPRTVQFAIDSKLDIAQFHCIDPYPMTKVYFDFLKQNRLLEEKWWLNEKFPKVRYHPKNMSNEELYEGILWCYRQFYSGTSILKRIGLRHVTDLVKSLLYGVSNIKFMNKSVPWIVN
jgi:radical SAM superfamily enzyme YgiQ (UPF0313 family)